MRRRDIIAMAYSISRTRPRDVPCEQATLLDVDHWTPAELTPATPAGPPPQPPGSVKPAPPLPDADLLRDRLYHEQHLTGLDFTDHALTPQMPALRQLGVQFAADLVRCPPRAKILVAGVRSVVHTPPTRSGTRVIFITLDDPTGLVDVAFFPAAQGPHSAAAMTSHTVLVEGTITTIPPRSINIVAHRAWDLSTYITAQGLANPNQPGSLAARRHPPMRTAPRKR